MPESVSSKAHDQGREQKQKPPKPGNKQTHYHLTMVMLTSKETFGSLRLEDSKFKASLG